jgi:curved DNA-binding protein CbpA
MAHMAERDAYEVLQVSRRASWREVRTAYRALARRYHPDGTTPDADHMVAINSAYNHLDREQREGRSDASNGTSTGPGTTADGASSAGTGPAVPTYGPLMDRVMAARRVETPVVDFGQYAGWRIAEIAEHDPRYLRWLSRHPSGNRFRAVIEQVLGDDTKIGRRVAPVR